MSNVLTDFRVALQTLLAATFTTTNLEVLSGEQQGGTPGSRDRDRACVFAAPLVPDGTDVNDARPRMTIRYWKPYPKIGPRLAEVPVDPSELEQLMLDMAAMLQPKLTTLGVSTLSYFHVDSISHDMEEYGVEVQLTGWMRNPMETGG